MCFFFLIIKLNYLHWKTIQTCVQFVNRMQIIIDNYTGQQIKLTD